MTTLQPDYEKRYDLYSWVSAYPNIKLELLAATNKYYFSAFKVV